MRSGILLMVVALMLFGMVAMAADAVAPKAPVQSAFSNLSVDTGYTYSVKNINNLKTNRVTMGEELTGINYKLNDSLVPYIQLGATWIDVNSISNMLVKNTGVFTYGVGIKGRALTVKGIDVGYDVRRLALVSNGDDEAISYTEYDAALKLSKEIALKGVNFNGVNLVQSITPMVGYRYSNVAGKLYGVSDNANLHSLLFGTGIKITDAISANIEGSYFGDRSILASVAYKF